MLKNILLLSDTHGYIDKKIISYTNNVDEVWHAGDIGDIRVIDRIKLSNKNFKIISMGMTLDYNLAIKNGSNMFNQN